MERRKHRRINVNHPVEIKLYAVQGRDDLSDVLVSCTAGDISAEGVKLHMNTDLLAGSAISLRISLPDPPSLFTLHGVVRWTRPDPDGEGHIIGLELSDPADNYLYEWRRMTNELHGE